jgi:hypothetical protein
MKISEAKIKIKQAGGDWEVFSNWMYGQTCGIDSDGEPDIYECDVDRFIRYKCNPRNEPLLEWD